MSLKRKAAIIGIADLKPQKDPAGETALSLCAKAAKLTVEDAGLMKKDIDGLLVATTIDDFVPGFPSIVAEYLNIHPHYYDTVDIAGATACGMVWRAASAIDHGLCQAVLCVAGDTVSIVNYYDEDWPLPSVEDEFDTPFGPMGINSAYAMIAKRHMYEYGTTSQQLAKIAVDQRTNACANPNAYFYGKPITIEDVLNSPLIVDPLHMLDIVMPVAGASAFVVVSPKLAQRAVHQPVWLLGAGEYCNHHVLSQAPSITTSAVAEASKTAYQMAGLKPKDIDIVELYDCYTITVLISLEDTGFCRKGEGGKFVEITDLTYKGELPCNTNGGQLSFGQMGNNAGGMTHLTEAVRQLMGRGEERQVSGAKTALVNGNGDQMSQECTIILGV